MTNEATDIQPVIACPFCGASEFTVIYKDIPDTDSFPELEEPYNSLLFDLVECNQCSTWYLRNPVIQDEIGRFYGPEYHCFMPFEDRGPLWLFLARMFVRLKSRHISSVMPSDCPVLLDFGCGCGSWLHLLQQIKVPWKLVGTDLMADQIATVKRFGLEGYVCNDASLGQHIDPNSVGVIHLWHVIEHLPDPLTALKNLKRALVPGGLILGQTPSVDSWDSRLFAENWNQVHVPRHLVFFDKKTLEMFAQKAGLEVVYIKNTLVSALNWSASFLKTACSLMGRRFNVADSRLFTVISVLFVPVALFQLAFSGSSSIDFAFRKPVADATAHPGDS